MEIAPIKAATAGPELAQKPARDVTQQYVAVAQAQVAGQAGTSVTAGREISREEVEGAVAVIQAFVQSVRRDVNFSLDDASERVVVKVMDAESGNVIRQIPSEEALQLAENLSDIRSLLFKAEA